ncbi:MAG TPA: hypothetical protein VF637_12070 [Sphingomicrobium sp.]|jgi:hypothetical protein
MSDIAAARFREQTAGDENRLEPRKVEGGTYKNQFVLPERVKSDPNHAAHYDAFAVLNTVAIDTEIAFPQPVEE